jgi:hypothetical protein
MKLMEMGGREEIMMEIETIIPIILLESVDRSLINPFLKRDTIHRRWLIFIFTQKINAS